MSKHKFDINAFLRDISAKRDKLANDAGMSIPVRIMAQTISINESAWFRMFRDKEVPKMETFLTICNHLDLDPKKYFTTKQ